MSGQSFFAQTFDAHLDTRRTTICQAHAKSQSGGFEKRAPESPPRFALCLVVYVAVDCWCVAWN